MSFISVWQRRIQKKYRIIYKRGPSTLALIFAGMAIGLWALFAALTSYPVGLYLYYTIRPATTRVLAQALKDTVKAPVMVTDPSPTPTPSASPEITQPIVIEKDVSLPDGHYLSIPKIGVDTILWEGSYDNYESVLRKGVWRVPDFSTPDQAFLEKNDSTIENQHKPMILAAHRFGYVDWTQDFRIKNSFYNLPKVTVGDKIEVIWDQHRYEYEVDRVTEGTKIDDYSGDLILYTCKFLVSPIRYFVYAKLVN